MCRSRAVQAAPTAPLSARSSTDVALVGDRERLERRLTEEIGDQPGSASRDSAAAVRSAAAEIMCVEIVAVGRPSLYAKPAMAAGHECEDHVSPGFHLGDTRANLLDNAGAFMAEHDRLRHRVDLVRGQSCRCGTCRSRTMRTSTSSSRGSPMPQRLNGEWDHLVAYDGSSSRHSRK